MAGTPGHRIAADLRAAILDGTYQPGAPLPSGASLMASYNEWPDGAATERDIRAAFGELTEDGLVTSQGPGHFVADPLPDLTRFRLTEEDLRRFEECRRRGRE